MVLDQVLSLFFNSGILQHFIESPFRYFFRRVSANRDEVIVVWMHIMFVPATSIFSPPMFLEQLVKFTKFHNLQLFICEICCKGNVFVPNLQMLLEQNCSLYVFLTFQSQNSFPWANIPNFPKGCNPTTFLTIFHTKKPALRLTFLILFILILSPILLAHLQ